MSDIEKLHKVINSLEEQSAKVNEFSGVLSALNSTKEQIEGSRSAIGNLANEQGKLVSESYKNFEAYGSKITELEAEISKLKESNGQILSRVSELVFLTPEQFESGRDKLLLRISELKTVSPEQFEQGSKAIEATVSEEFAALHGHVTTYSARLDASIRSLITTVIIGTVLILAVLAFLAKDSLLAIL